MARYSALVTKSQTLPQLWLLSDQRNDRALESALMRLPAGSGFVFRHYHLPEPQRYQRFRALQRIARSRGHCVVLADSALTARYWNADGIYGAPRALYPRRDGLIRIATAHNMREVGLANRFGSDYVMISPVYPTRSHPGASALGLLRFKALAFRAKMPVIALGGMSVKGARRLKWARWAAIDALS